MKIRLIVASALFFSFSNCNGQKHLSDVEQIVENLKTLLVENYIYHDKGEEMAAVLKSNFSRGSYSDIQSYEQLALAIDEDLHEVVDDKHLRIRYGSRSPNPSTKNTRYGIQSYDIIEENIGLLDLRGFTNPDRGMKEMIFEVMSNFKTSKAIIIDLRNNGGGSPGGVQLISSYFFPSDPSVHLNTLYFRNRDERNEFYTLDDLEGERMPEIPLYILTSSRTFSAAEEFTYNMKNLERATIIGEITGGGAHPVGSFSLPHGLRAIIPVGRAINPITGTNWEGVGVIPDIEVSSDDALQKAVVLINTGH